MLILHSPNWRRISDIKPEGTSWVDLMKSFLLSSDCPNFMKADVEKTKQKIEEQSNDNQNDDDSDQKFAFDIVLKCIHNYIENLMSLNL